MAFLWSMSFRQLPFLGYDDDVMNFTAIIDEVAPDAFGIVQFPLGGFPVPVDIDRLVVLEVLAVGGPDGQVGAAGQFATVAGFTTRTGNGFSGGRWLRNHPILCVMFSNGISVCWICMDEMLSRMTSVRFRNSGLSARSFGRTSVAEIMRTRSGKGRI